MKSMNPKLVATVRSAMKGKKLEKFNASIAILNESLKQGAWTLRGSVKANSGFYQGLSQVNFDRTYSGETGKAAKAQDYAWSIGHCLNFGGGFKGDFESGYKVFIDSYEDPQFKSAKKAKGRKIGEYIGLTKEQIKAWVDLCNEKNDAYKLLNEARPKPVLTKILLSPKVTMTLKEMNIDIDVSTVKEPEIVVWKTEPMLDKNKKHMRDARTGKLLYIKWYRIKWEKGCQHGMSRFAGKDCEACGKTIPSHQFNPIEAIDRKSGKYVSFWLGCDCARNIFGVKAKGIDRRHVAK